MTRPDPRQDEMGVTQADRDAAARAVAAFMTGNSDRQAEEFAAHRRAATISTPREDEVERVFHAIDACMSAFNGFENWRMQQGRAVPADEIITLDRVAERIAFAQKVVLAAPASLATLTPREQRMEEALRHALTFIENRYSDLSPEKRATVSHIRSALSLQDKT